jgi:ubiquinone/menaquinone biosynthesis C-methylase UbiE
MSGPTRQSTEPRPSAELFEAVYRGDSLYGARPPWEIDRPQPAFVALEEAGHVQGAVLDPGCGTGDTAIFLADKGHTVTGVDFSVLAIADAQRKAAERGVDVTFRVDDVLDMTGDSEQFDTVVDGGTAPMFGPQGLTHYAAQLHRVSKPGAVAHVLAISESGAAHLQRRLAEEYAGLPSELPKNDGPDTVRRTVDYVTEGFRRHWTVESVTDSVVLYVLPSKDEIVEPAAWLYRFRRI